MCDKLKAWRGSEQHPKGNDKELITIAGVHRSKLFVLCGDHFEASKAFREGEFTARIIRLSGAGRAVAMATCMVGDHQWMLAKDSMALRVGEGTFVFALPGVLYGLSVPRESLQKVLRQLEDIFLSYSAYHDLVDMEVSDSKYPKPKSDIWSLAYEKLENLAAMSCTKIAVATAPAEKSVASGNASNDVAATKIQRAERMSAAVKLVSRALLSGGLVPDIYLHVALPPPPEAAFPSVWALTGVLEAIESSGRRTAVPGAPSGRAVGFWWLRMEGVELLLEMVRAYGVAARKRPRLDAAYSEEGGGDAVPLLSAAAGMGKGLCGGGGGKAGGVEQHLETWG